MMERARPNGIVGALEAMRDRPDSTPLLRMLATVPTLLLIGECDARTPRASMQAMAEQIPGARSVTATIILRSRYGQASP